MKPTLNDPMILNALSMYSFSAKRKFINKNQWHIGLYNPKQHSKKETEAKKKGKTEKLWRKMLMYSIGLELLPIFVC